MTRYSLVGSERVLLVAVLLVAVLLGLPACGSDNKPFTARTDSSLAQQDNVRTWANTVSAFGVYANVYQPIAVADGHETFPDASCPAVADDGTTLTATGDCTEASGTRWVGSATVVRSANGDRTLTLHAFGTDTPATKDKPAQRDVRDGEAHVRPSDETHQDFDLSLVHSGGMTTTFDYQGSVEGDYDVPTRWNGSGTVERDGVLAPVGTVNVSTTDEVVDNATCSGQPLSGNTEIENAANETVVITYDGAVDCDAAQAASYRLNGEDQGEITGIACTIAPGRGGGRARAAVGFGALLGLLLARQRRRQARAVGPAK